MKAYISVGIAMDYWLVGPGSIPGMEKHFFHSIQTDCGAHPANGYRGRFRRE
jgi:hypothetical protein